ncbi:hypothetical protein INT45_013797, partial [Circinella minor]
MYAKNPEEFDVKWNEFRQYYLVEDITFYTYMFDYYYPKREKWSKAWREGIHFHTNNLIESWHNQLKTHYLKKTRKHRIDYIVWLITQVVDCVYRQSILQVFHGFEDVSLTKEEKKQHQTAYELDDDTAAEYISIVDAQKIYVKSFKKENIYYEIAVREGVLHSCTCPDFYFNRILYMLNRTLLNMTPDQLEE